MPIDFYYVPASPPCRTVHMLAGVLGLELNLKFVNTMEKEQLKPEFLKINPQHTVPTIVDDDGFALWESRAICRYLIVKYGQNTTLYPKDLKTRALIDQRVDFDIGTLYPKYRDYFWPQIMGGAADPAAFAKLDEVLKLLNTFLEGQEFAVGSELTLADIVLVSTVSTIDAGGVCLEPYPNITKWYAMLEKTIPDYDETNRKGIDMYKVFVAKIKADKSLLK